MLIPRHYQVEGIKYLTTPRVKVNKDDQFPTLCRSLLSDAPGAGKTPQSCWAATELANKDESIMVICPAFLVNQWFDAIHELYPNDSIVSLEGPKPRRIKDAAKNARWYIVGVQSLRKTDMFELVSTIYRRQHINVTIIDESHYVKNGDAIQSKHVRKLTDPANCNHVILLSATPIVKEADDLWHQLRIIDPIQFPAFHQFLNRYCYFEWTSWGATNVTLRKSAHAELEAQRTIICKNGDTGTRLCGNTKSCICHEVYLTNTDIPRPMATPHPVGQCCYEEILNNTGWILGRTYAQIGLELPPIIPDPAHAVVKFPLDKDRQKVYNDIKWAWASTLKDGETLSASSAMEVMHLLRRVTNSPEKSFTLSQYMEDDPGPYVIACFYKLSAHDLAKLVKLKHPEKNPIVISGELDTDTRHRLARSSTNPNDVVIATIPSITEGIDLSHANTVYFYEEDYTPGRMYQFLSRVRRHRKTDNTVTLTPDESGFTHLHIDEDPNATPVICRYFNAANTVDERIHAVQSLRSVNIRDLIKVELTS